jgi:hypothetical protein
MSENDKSPQSVWARIGGLGPAWLTAIATLIIALTGAGVFAAVRATVTAGPTPTPTVTVTVTHTATPQAGNGGGSGTQASGKIAIPEHHVVLPNNYAITFTDPSLSPSSIPNTIGCAGDLYICANGAFIDSSAQLAVIDGPARLSQCRADRHYVSSDNSAAGYGQSLVGKTLCVTTGTRIAICHVTEDTTLQSVAAPGLTMDVTVYVK